MQKTSKFALLSVMLCFFAMGFVDLVGIASNYVKEDLGLNDKTANIFPSLVFFWFLIFSVPTGTRSDARRRCCCHSLSPSCRCSSPCWVKASA